MEKAYEYTVITIDRTNKANEGTQLLHDDLNHGFEVVRADATNNYIVYILRKEIEPPEGYSSWEEYDEKGPKTFEEMWAEVKSKKDSE